MNDRDYERYKMEILSKCRNRPIQGAVRPSGKESLKHWLKKAELMYAFNNGTLGGLPFPLLEHFIGEDLRDISAFSEVRWNKNLISDLAIILRGKTIVIEVLESEKDTDVGIKRKRRAYTDIGFDFAVY